MKNIIIISGLLLLLAFGYYLFVLNGNGSVVSNNSLVENQVIADTQEFVRRLNELKTIELDVSAVTDNRFGSLIDYSADVTPVPVGRTDPFAPVQ